MEKYDNLGMVGEGSYGMVMKCKHKETGQIVAIKKFLESEDDKMVKKIAMREVRMLRKLRHENLVNLIEVFRRRKRLYLVFEFVDHTVLDDLEKYPNGLSEMTVRKILWQVLRGVEFCHSHNIIHRDIKPENILNSRSGVIKICDFGFARTLASHGEIYTDYVATRWYRAPELLVGDTKYGRPVDVWAVGCLVGEMLAGDPMFPGKSDMDQLHRVTKSLGNLSPRHREIFQRNPLFAGMRLPEVKEVDPLEKRFPKFSSEVIDLMKQCLRLDPNERPSSSALLRHEFFKKDNFEEKVIPEIRARIQKDHQQSMLTRKNLAEKQQQQQQEAENRKKRRSRDSTGKDPLPTPQNAGSRQSNVIGKSSPRDENKNVPDKNLPGFNSPKKDSLAILKPQQNISKTPPSEEAKKRKEAEKERKLPPTIKQDGTMTGASMKQASPVKQQTPLTKEDFSSPRTLIPKMTNESMTRAKEATKTPPEVAKTPQNSLKEEKKETSQEVASTPAKTPEDSKFSSKDSEIQSKPAKSNKSPPPSRDPKSDKPPPLKEPKIDKTPSPAKDPRQDKSQTPAKNGKPTPFKITPQGPPKGGAETPKAEPGSRGSEKWGEKGNFRPDVDGIMGGSGSNLALLKTVSDTALSKEKLRGSKLEKFSTSTPPSPNRLIKAEESPPEKPKREKSPKQEKTRKEEKLRKEGPEKKIPRTGDYHIPPIQSQGTPTQSMKLSSQEDDSPRQFPTQGIRVLEKTKKSSNKDSFSPQTSYEKNMYGSTVSNFEKMMMSMSGATAISHPAIKKTPSTNNTQTGSSSSVSPYAQSQSPYAQQFGHHFSQEKIGGGNLPLWSSASYYDKQTTHRNSMVDGKGADHEKRHKPTDEKGHHRHHRKHEDKMSDDKHGKDHMKTNEEKTAAIYMRDQKRTRLPDLMSRGMGAGMSTSRDETFPSLKPTGTGLDHQKRKQKIQKAALTTIPSLEPTVTSKQHGNDPSYPESNFPSVRRKN